MAQQLWYLWGFSLLGWMLERLFAVLVRSPRQRRRCLLLSPLCPVYGLGMAALLTLPPPLLSGWRLPVSGALITTAVEYSYHWLCEVFLHLRPWDYTGLPGSLQGRVCLPFSIAWGALTVPAVCFAAPVFRTLADWTPPALTWLLLMVFSTDVLCSLRYLRATHDLESLRQAIWARRT